MTSLVALRSDWHREALRTNLWLVLTIEVIAALYFGTHALDKSAFDGGLTLLPSWMVFGTPDAGAPDPHDPRRRGHHRGRRGVLDHDRDAHARLDTVVAVF